MANKAKITPYIRNKKIVIDGGAIKDEYTKDMVQALTKLGYRAMMYAYGKHEFKHRTRNLHDSYASAVYVNGVLVEESIRYVGGVLSRAIDKKTGKTGRATVNDELRNRHYGGVRQEIVLVVVAAMYYAGYLEHGDKNNKPYSRGIGDKFIVISPARRYIDKNYMTYVGKVYEKWGLTGADKPRTRVVKGFWLD